MTSVSIKAYLKDASLQTMAGGSAGFVEVCIMHPLDLIKTRLQIQTKITTSATASHVYYNGVFDCFAKMYRTEGLKSFWKGLFPPILAETPKRAVKFVTFEQYKRFFMFGSQTPTPLTFSLAGLGAGITEAIFVNPFEVVKVKMQADRRVGKEILPSTILITKQIVKDNGFGLNGLNRGLTATMARNGCFNMIYFGFYHSVKGYFEPLEDPINEFFRKVFIGLISGTMASCFNIPFDVAKSRIQGPQPIAGEIKYKTTIGSMMTVAKEEGVLALYKGLVPKIMRLGPGGAIMLLVYEYSYEYLKERFP